jgi:monoterpene epsilon-lactone hydrolase
MSEDQMRQIRCMLKDSGGARDLSIEERRTAMAAMTDMLPVPDEVVAKHQASPIPGDWLTTPASKPGRVVLYLHGGAYIAGSPETHHSLAGKLCLLSCSRGFLADYRLAPENPFPAAVEDAVGAYRWLLHSSGLAEYGESAADHVIVAGDSAGGGLSVAMLVSAREQGLPMPAGLVCMSPWADLSCSGVGYGTRSEADPINEGDNIARIAAYYLNGTNPRVPLASPAFADLSGLPAMLIQVGADEVLIGDSLLLEAQAHRSGVSATLEVWAGMVHVWQAFYPMLGEGLEALERIARFCEKRWEIAGVE